MVYQRSYPDHPWLTRQANEILAGYLRQSDVCLEFGSGRSTLWFAKHVGHITSVENNALWYKKVSTMLNNAGQQNVSYFHVQMDKEDREGGDSAYVKTIDKFATDSVDFVLVDGAYRDYCAQKAIRVIRPGGLLVIDNVNWYLPSDSGTPSSRTYEQGPNGTIWADVSKTIAGWRSIWTSSGVSDTAFYIKPYM